MTKQIKPFDFQHHEGVVGHSVGFGPTRAGKTTFVSVLDFGHPGGIVSTAQAGIADLSSAKSKGAAPRSNAPYYRQFEKRK